MNAGRYYATVMPIAGLLYVIALVVAHGDGTVATVVARAASRSWRCWGRSWRAPGVSPLRDRFITSQAGAELAFQL